MAVGFILTISRQNFLMYVYPFLKLCLTNLAKKSSFIWSFINLFLMKKLVINYSGPTTSSETQTMPQRLTVAGDAWFKSLT